jgi:hypothetical protein
MGSRGRFLLSRLVNDLLHLGSRHRARSAWPRGVLLQSCDVAIEKALAPARRFLWRDAQLGGDFLVLPSIRSPQHNAGALNLTGWQGPCSRLLLQQPPLFGIQSKWVELRASVVLHSKDEARSILVTIYVALH